MNANKKVFSDNLKKYLRKKNISQSEFAKLLNYPETTVSNWINANTYPRIDKIEEISRFFGITKSELTEENLPENLIKISRVTMIPVLGEIACGDPIWVSENYDGYFALDNSLNADFILVAKELTSTGVEVEKRRNWIVWNRATENAVNYRLQKLKDSIKQEAIDEKRKSGYSWIKVNSQWLVTGNFEGLKAGDKIETIKKSGDTQVKEIVKIIDNNLARVK